MDKKTILWVVIIFAFSVVYRYVLATIGPNYIQHDSAVYQQMAVDMYDGKWVTDGGNRTFYYPLFVVSVFRMLGFDSIFGMRFAQSLVDSLTGLMVFFVTLSISQETTPSFIAYIFYALNPITATYTGLYLTEVLSAFSTVLVLWSSLRKRFLWLGWGMATALWGTVRLVFFPVSFLIIILGSMSLAFKNFRAFLTRFSLAWLGFAIMMIYPLISNFMVNHSFNLYPNSDISKFYLYEGLQAHSMPEYWNGRDSPIMPKQVVWSWDYYNLPPNEYHQKANEILGKYFGAVIKNPLEFGAWRLVHAVKVWNKSHLYYYLDPSQPVSGILLPIVNILLIALAVIGFIKLQQKLRNTKPLFTSTVIIMILISTALFSLKPPEERLTVPLYPIIFIFAGLGVSTLIKNIKNKKLNNTIQV
jgi:hypothetical protein